MQGRPLDIVLDVESSIESSSAAFAVAVHRNDGILIWSTMTFNFMNSSFEPDRRSVNLFKGAYEVRVKIPYVLFNSGNYYLNVGIEPKPDTARVADYHDWQTRVISFSIVRSDPLIVARAFDSPSGWIVDRKPDDASSKAGDPGVVVMPFPHPYRAAVAISTDCEFTTRDAYQEMFAELSDPNGLDLEVPNSMFLYATHSVCHSSISYFEGTTNRPSADAAFLRDLTLGGWIDTIHAYGDFDAGGFTRAMAEVAADECARSGMAPLIFSNHGNDQNTQNVGHRDLTTYQRGDLPGAAEYHLDMTTGLGVRYFWLDSEIQPSPTTIGSPLRRVTARDGQEITLFSRYRGLVGKPAPNMGSLAEQIQESDLDQLVENRGLCIYYQHLGVASKNADGTNNVNNRPYIPADARKRLARLSELQRKQLCLVTGPARLLRYVEVRDSLSASIENGTLLLKTSRPGTRVHDFEGMTLRIPRETPVDRVVTELTGRSTELTFRRVEMERSAEDIIYMPWSRLDRSAFR